MQSPIVVTGAAGFIGSHVVRALVDGGRSVVGIDNFDPLYDRRLKERNLVGLDAGAFELVTEDIRDAAAMNAVFERCRPGLLVHIAALAGVRPSIEDPAGYVATNVSGLMNVLEAARGAGCRRIVTASSSSVYGDRSEVPFRETDDVSSPISPYAATKRAGELLCHSHAHLFGLSIAALRFFTVYGPAQRPDLAISKFLRGISAGEEIPMFGDGSSCRDYTYIDDIVAGVLAACRLVEETAGDAGLFRIFNLGGSQPVTLRDLIDAIAGVVGREPRIKTLPMQPGDVTRTFADLTRSRAELGFEPTTPLTEGLEQQWAWTRAVWPVAER